MARRALGIGLLLGFLVAVSPLHAQDLPPASQILSERILGKTNAPVTLIEYASKTCSHCAAFHADVLPTLKKEYVETGKVKFIYREFPLNRLDVAVSMIARCGPPGRFFPLVDLIYKTQAQWARAQDPLAEVIKIGRLAGITPKIVEACLRSREIFQGIVDSGRRGQAEFNISATPAIIVNGRPVNGNVTMDVLRPILDRAAVGN